MTLRGARAVAVSLMVACICLAVLIFKVASSPGTTERLARKSHLLPHFDRDAVTRLRVTRPGNSALVLERDPKDRDSFRLGEVNGQEADAGLVAALLGAIDQERIQSRYDSPSDEILAPLRHPDFEISIETRTQTDRIQLVRAGDFLLGKVSFGDDDPEYVTLGLELIKKLSQDASEFVARSLFTVSKSETRQLLIQRSGVELLLRPSSFGFALGEKGERAERDLIDALFFQLAKSELKIIRDRSLVEPALQAAPAAITVEQVGQDGAITRVVLGGDCEPADPNNTQVLALELTGQKRAGCADGAIMAVLRLDADRLLDKHLLPLRPDEIDHVVIEGAGGTVDLLRKDEAFEVTLHLGRRPLDQELGTRFIKALASLEGARSSGSPPARAAVLRAVGHGPHDIVIDERIAFWEEAGQLFVRRADAVVLALSERDASLLKRPEQWLLTRALGIGEKHEIEKVTVQSSQGTTLISRSPEGFRLQPEGGLADARLTEEFLETLTHLEAIAFLSEKPASGTPAALTIRVQSGTEERVLTIFERRLGGFRASLTGIPDKFILRPSVVETLSRSLASRDPLDMQLERASRVILERRGKESRRLELVRRGEELTPSTDSPGIEGEDLRTALESLSPLFARPDVKKPAVNDFLTITIESEQGQEPLLLWFYELSSGSVPGYAEVVAFSNRSPLGFAFDQRSTKRLLDAF